MKQADAYEHTADNINISELPQETPLAKVGMAYLGDVLTLNRKEFNRYVVDHENYLTATAEKLRGEMAGLAHFVHKAEKSLRDQVQLKIAADLKLDALGCRPYLSFAFPYQESDSGPPYGRHIAPCL